MKNQLDCTDRKGSDQEISENAKIIARLQMLLTIAQKVENPSFAVTFEEIIELLLDFGVMCQNSHIYNSRGDDIHDDPLDRTDSLGNILMIHRRMKATDSEILETLGDEIVNLASLAFARFQVQEKYELDADKLFYQIDPSDDTSSESLLDAKRLIAHIRKENLRLDRRNSRLYEKLQHYKRLCKTEIDYKALYKNSNQNYLDLKQRVSELRTKADVNDLQALLEELKTNQRIQSLQRTSVRKTTSLKDICTVDDDEKSISRTRNSKEDGLSDSQLESLKW
jgi:hypothetical protein